MKTINRPFIEAISSENEEDLFYLGIGTNNNASFKGVKEFITSLMQVHHVSVFAGIATLQKDHCAFLLQNMSDWLGLEIVQYPANILELQKNFVANPSGHVFKSVGCHSVAEAAALTLAGKNARILMEKTVFNGLTFAIAASNSNDNNRD